jgi:hypothetical protein
LLRDSPQFQFSSRKAKAAANALWPLIAGRDDRDEGDREDREARLKEAVNDECLALAKQLQSFSQILTKGR